MKYILRHAKSEIWDNIIGPKGGKNKDTGLDWFDAKWKSILVLNWSIKRSDCLINFDIQLKTSLRYVIVNIILRYVD